jgi:hypothetical protein
MHTSYNPLREQEHVENLCPTRFKNDAHFIWSLSYQNVHEHINSLSIFESFAQAKQVTTHEFIIHQQELQEDRNIHLMPVSLDQVTYTKKQMSGVPVSFLFDSTIEFTSVPSRLGAYLGFIRSPDEQIHTLHTRFGTFQGVFRSTKLIQPNKISKCWNIPIFWRVLNNGPNIPLLGRRGFYPTDFVQIGRERVHHPMISRYLQNMKLLVPVQIAAEVHNFIIDTLAPESKFIQESTTIPIDSIQILDSLTVGETIHGVLGLDFLFQNPVLFYQGHPLFHTRVLNANNQTNDFIEELSLTPLEKSLHCFHLYYHGNNGVSFIDYFVNNVNKRTTRHEQYDISQGDFTCGKLGNVPCMICIIKVGKNCLYLNQVQIKELEIVRGESSELDVTIGELNVILEFHTVHDSCFPLVMLNADSLYMKLWEQALESVPIDITDMIITIRVISNGNTRSVVKLACLLQLAEKQDQTLVLPWQFEQTELVVPTSWSPHLNMNSNLYCKFPKQIYFEGQTRYDYYKPIQITTTDDPSLLCTIRYKT